MKHNLKLKGMWRGWILFYFEMEKHSFSFLLKWLKIYRIFKPGALFVVDIAFSYPKGFFKYILNMPSLSRSDSTSTL